MADSSLFSDDMREIVDSFVVETQELLDGLDNQLLQLEQTPDDPALVDEIFRAVHTIKGTSGFLSLDQINQLTHSFEEVLNLIRKREREIQPGVMDVLFEAFDITRVLVRQVMDERIEELDLGPILARLEAVARGEDQAPRASDNDAVKPSAQPPPSDAQRPAETPRETIRVDVERLDHLLNLVGELVLGRNRLSQLVGDLRPDLHETAHQELGDTSGQIDAITTELQSAIMRTRMVPIRRVFSKFPRVVRDLAKEFGKQIELELEGEDTELDKSLIEEIGDPLVHLIRNAADHGIESPEVRQRSGKSDSGRIRLSAAHEGNHVVIRITDDGAGMDPEKLKQRAIDVQAITAREAEDLGDVEALQLIFRPGFSTADRVSKVSGRGVGMDVVKTNITRLNGTITIESEVGKGSTFTLKLPLTLAIIQSLLVQVGGEAFAVPLHAVIEVVYLAEQDVASINGREVLRLRDQVLPLVRTGEVLDVPDYEQASLEGRHAVIVGVAHHRLGLVVDGLIGQKEVVIKPLGRYLRAVPGIAGSTILGDGRVIMIVDVGEIVRLHSRRGRLLAAGSTAA